MTISLSLTQKLSLSKTFHDSPCQKGFPTSGLLYHSFSITSFWYILTCIFIIVIYEYVAQKQHCKVLESQKSTWSIVSSTGKFNTFWPHGRLSVKMSLIGYFIIQPLKEQVILDTISLSHKSVCQCAKCFLTSYLTSISLQYYPI